MAADRFIDFDQAWSERDAEPLVAHLFGKDWELPAVMPAAAPLKIARYMSTGRENDDLTEGETLDLAADIIPADTLRQWLNRGLDIDQLGEILLWVMGQYQDAEEGGDGEAAAVGEGQAPEAGQLSSLNDGTSSKPTSPASTASGSPKT